MGRPTKNPSTILGARASTAGDVFHELWALRTALRLITPQTNLKAITVEGIASPPGSDHIYDGVDCGLFYGAPSLEHATRVEFVQLKYSTAQPETAWTVARLTANSATKGDNSVIRKLATDFAKAQGKLAPGAILVTKLISNQPLASEVGDVIAKIRASDYTDSSVSRFAEASGLSKPELLAFLDALDFSDMGSGSRSSLQDAIAREVSLISGDKADTLVLQMQSAIRRLMLPEAAHEIITAGSVLSWFGISTTSALFPAPADLQPMGDAVQRTATSQVREALLSGNILVCLHGLGGCGKTTTMQQVQAALPDGSISALFDCYGAGRYSHSNDRRHLPENAFLQIINDLAVQQGVPMLLAKQSSQLVNIRTFIERIKQSAELLEKASPHGLLTVLIDAADNSVTAAEHEQATQACFVWELANADLRDLPANVRFVLSSRTGRKDQLRLPSGTVYIDCCPFTEMETRAYVDKRMPGMSADWLKQFHHLSSGIPRVQAYAFAKGCTSPPAVLDALRPSGKGLETVLRELFQDAANKAGQDFYGRCVAAIDTLPGPIPLKHLAAVCGTTVAVISDFISDVRPTLRIEEQDTVTIADEDVEDFLAFESQSRHQQILEVACTYLEAIYRTDSYAATHYCDLLTEAGRASEILPLIQKDVIPAGISDPVVRHEVQVRRSRLALAACRNANDVADILKVILLSAEAANNEAALRQLLEQEPELSVRFASGSLLRLVLADRDSYPRQGPILVQDALRASMTGDATTANEQLHLYHHWMKRRQQADRHHEWKQSHEDIVAFAQTIAILRGATALVKHIRGWRPLTLRLSIALDLVPELINCGRRDIVELAYSERVVSERWNLLLSVPLALSGYQIQKERLEGELAALGNRIVPDAFGIRSYGDHAWELRFLETIVTACEIGYVLGVARATLQYVLGLLLVRRDPTSRVFHTDAGRIDVVLRAWLLCRALEPVTVDEDKDTEAKEAIPSQALDRIRAKCGTSEQFIAFVMSTGLPVKKKKRQKGGNITRPVRDSSDDDLKRVVDGIYRIYVARIVVLTEATLKPVEERPVTDLALGIESYTFNLEHYGNQYRTQVAGSVARLMHIAGLSAEYLFACTARTLDHKSEGPFAYRSLPVWREFLARQEVHQKIVDDIVARSMAIKEVRTSAREKVNAFLGFSKLVLKFSSPDAQALFEDAVKITQEIDREAMVQIEFVSGLTNHRDHFTTELRRELAVGYATYVTDVAIRLSDEEYFPWKQAISAIYDLSPEVALAAISQWQDEGLADFGDSLSPILLRIANEEHDPILAAALLGLLKHVPEGSFTSLIDGVNACAEPERTVAFELLSKKVLLDVFPNQRVALLKSIAERLPNDLRSKPGDITTRLKAEAKAIEEPKDDAADKETRSVASVSFPPDADFSTCAGICAAVQTAMAEERQKGSYLSLRTILTAARDIVKVPAHRSVFLDALGEFNEDGFDADDRALVILDTLEIWRSPAIDRWKELRLPGIIRANLWGLTRWLREGVSRLPALIRASGLHGQALVDMIAGALEERSKEYGSGSLFALCEIMVSSLAGEDANTLTKWYIARLTEKVPEDIAGRFSVAEMPEDVHHAVGRFLFAQFSDIDLRVRWRAAHCLRGLTASGAGWAIKNVLDAYNRKADGAFRLRGAPFYWLAARLFAVMTTARISVEEPEVVTALAPALFAIATDDTLPHFLIRGYAKDALEALVAHDVTVLSAHDRKTLAAVNRPRMRPKRGKKGDYRELSREQPNGVRFKFNSLDTIPYWYSPLYRLFAELSPKKFFETLDRWLIEVWSVDPESNWWDKEPRRRRYGRDSLASYHRQGSLPSVERHGTYLEWHAMFCGLGEWLETEHLRAPEDHFDSLEHWANRWKPTETPAWLADRRGHRPNDAEFIVDNGGNDNQWLRRVPKSRFKAVVCGGNGAAPGLLAISGDWTVSGKTRQVDVEVNTALVEPASAHALLRTLSGEQRRFWLPTEREGDDDEESYAQSPFRLYGWLSRTGGDIEYDKDDPLRGEVGKLQVKPATSLVSAHDLTEIGMPVSVWRRGADQEWFRYEAWADWSDRDGDRRGQPRPTGSNGYRLLVREEALLIIMKRENLDLVADIQIERRLESEYGEPTRWDDKKRRKANRKILVFRQNGDIEDEGGCIGTWRRNS